MNGQRKIIVVFSMAEGQPPLLGDELSPQPGQNEVCASCPVRYGGLVVDVALEVASGAKASSGSKESGCKKISGQIIGSLVDEDIPACFHPQRWCEDPESMLG